MRQSETFTKHSVNAAIQLSLFIAELRRYVRLIEADIQIEEGRLQNLSNATYPTTARHLGVRRDNLNATISLLEGRRIRAAERGR